MSISESGYQIYDHLSVVRINLFILVVLIMMSSDLNELDFVRMPIFV